MKVSAALLIATLWISIFGDGVSGIDVSPRIVGGNTAQPEQFPFSASLRNQANQFICGAAVIGSRWGISAAHCTWQRSAENVFIVAGTNNRFFGGTSFAITNIEYFEYNPRTRENDICLLRTLIEINFSSAIQPLPINFQHIGADVEGIVTGWGSTIPGPGQPATLLQYLNKMTISNEKCAEVLDPRLPNFFPIIDSFLCTRGELGQGFCFGDSGGPLISEEGQLIGIVSWAIPCALGHPDVYIRLSPYEKWITNLLLT